MREYPPSEDSYLMLDHIRCGDRVLDMGTGSGIIALECARRGARVTAVDIDPVAVEKLRNRAAQEGLNVEVVHSNLFQNVYGKYDTIIFNPPYLPGTARELVDYQWAGGGEHGDEIILKFLKEAPNFLKDDGEIYIILSSFNRIQEIFRLPYRFEKLAQLKMAFHYIYLYRLKKA